MIEQQFVVEQLTNVAIFIAITLAAVIFLKAATFIIRKRFEGASDKARAKQATAIYQYTLVIITIFVLVVVFTNIFKSTLASVGILAAGLAIALQRPILNIFGWFTIVLKQPYAIGDRVTIGGSKGDVFEITMMHTNMSELDDDTPSGRMISVPNEFVLTQPVTNYTKGSPYVWDKLSLLITSDSDLVKAKQIVKKASARVTGGLMKELASKWARIDGRKIESEPEITMEVPVVNGASAAQITARYLCNVREKKAVRTQIYDLALKELKSIKGVRLK